MIQAASGGTLPSAPVRERRRPQRREPATLATPPAGRSSRSGGRCACVYIYIYIERERDVCMYVYIYIYIYTHIVVLCYSIVCHSTCFITSSSQRARRGREARHGLGLRQSRERLAQDKGGPGKGGFLNNRLYSYTVLYLCNEINGVYINN